MSRPTCRARRNDGEPCRGPSLPTSEFCWSHDEDRAEEMTAARSRGAAKANKLRSLEGRRLRLDNPKALVRFVSDVVQDTLNGKVPPDVARTALYGCSIQRQLLETSELERRLAALEEQLGSGATKRGGGRW